MKTVNKLAEKLGCKSDISLFILWYLTQSDEHVGLDYLEETEVEGYRLLSLLAEKYIPKDWDIIRHEVEEVTESITESDEDYVARLEDLIGFTKRIAAQIEKEIV